MHVLTDHTKRTHSSKIDNTFSHMSAHHTQGHTERTLSSRSIHSSSRSIHFFFKKRRILASFACMHVHMHALYACEYAHTKAYVKKGEKRSRKTRKY
jgi:hypothetical protein